jgi:peptidoglycan/LPS O-acetylase OafA/YrhL
VNQATNAGGELPNLDALRSLAVLLVLADHVLETLGQTTGRVFHPYDWYFGRLGVLLFFVHTCYVLMASMERLGTSGWTLTRTFYIRRAFRIYPLAAFCIGLVVILGVPMLPWESFTAPGAFDLASNLALTTNLTASPPVLAPLWSLPVEVQMYLVLPVMYLLTARATDLARIAAIYLLSLVLAWYVPHLSQRLDGTMYGPCFIAGIFAFALRRRVAPRLPAGFWPVFLLGIVGAYVAIDDAFPEQVHHVLLQAAICLAVGFAIPLFRESRFAALNRVTHLIAKYSYGIYLFHCVSLWLAYYSMPFASAPGKAAFALVSLVVLSVVSYHALESPAIRLGARLSRRQVRAALRPGEASGTE